MSQRFRHVCSNCEGVFVAKGGVPLTANALEDFLRAAHIVPDTDAVARFLGKINDQISRNEIAAKRKLVERKDQQQMQRSLRTGSISKGKLSNSQRRQSVRMDQSVRVDSNESSSVVSDSILPEYSPQRNNKNDHTRSFTERRFRLEPTLDANKAKKKSQSDGAKVANTVPSTARQLLQPLSPSNFKGRSASHQMGDDQRSSPSLTSPKNVTISIDTPIQPGATNKMSLTSSSCLVPVSAATALQVPLPLLVLLASVCDLLSYRNAQSSVGGAANDPLTGPRQLWQACGGDPAGRRPISFTALRAKVLELTGLDLGASKRNVFGGPPIPSASISRVSLGDVLKNQSGLPRSMSTTMGPASNSRSSPVPAPEDDQLEFSDLEKYFLQNRLDEKSQEMSALQKAKSVMLAAHAKGDSTRYIPSEAEANGPTGGVCPGGAGSQRSMSRTPHPIPDFREEVEDLFIEDFYGEAAAEGLQVDEFASKGLEHLPTNTLASSPHSATFSPNVQSVGSFGAFPATVTENNTLLIQPHTILSPAPSPTKSVTNTEAVNNSIAATWDALGVMIGEPTVGGSANDPLDPKAHCLRRALKAFRSLVGSTSQSLSNPNPSDRRKDSTNPFVAVAAAVKFAHNGKTNETDQTALGLLDTKRNISEHQQHQHSIATSLAPVRSQRGPIIAGTEERGHEGVQNSSNQKGFGGSTRQHGRSSQVSKIDSPQKPQPAQLTPLPVIIRNGQRATADVEALIQKLAAVDQLEASASFSKSLSHQNGSSNDMISNKVKINHKHNDSPLKVRMEKLRALAAAHGLTINEGKGHPVNEKRLRVPKERVESIHGGSLSSIAPKKQSVDASTQTDRIRRPKNAKVPQPTADDEIDLPPSF